MAPDPHVQIRHRFDKIISEARKTAVEQDKQDIQNLQLEKLSAEEQIKILTGKKQAIKSEADRLEKKEYYRLDRYDHLISILYLSRLICLDQDDEQAIRDGIRLNVKEQHIDLLLAKAKEQLGAFTYEDYLDNQPQWVFDELDEKPALTTEENYQKICTWQTNQKISCIKLEFNRFRENFRYAVKDEIIIHDTLLNEINQLQDILSNAATWEAQRLMGEFKKLKALSGILWPNDHPLMHHEFTMFLQGNDFRNRLSPLFFEKAIENIEEGKASPLPIFGLSLMMYFRWLKSVSMCKKMAFHHAESSFDALFANTWKEGQEKKNVLLDNVKKKAMDRSYNERHYERFILQGMEEKRKVFNSLKYPHYFKFLEQEEILKNCFIEDCLRSLNLELPKEALRKTILMDEYIQFYSEELSLLKHHPLIPSADQLSEIAVMTETLCHMAPDSELINLFLDTRELIKKQVYKERIPFFLICENLKDLFTDIFEKAVKNFYNLVDNLPLNDKGLFISELLHKVNYMETINGIKCRQKNIFFKQFKHLLKKELKIIHEMQSFPPAKGKDNNILKDEVRDKPLNFGYHQGPKELLPVVKAMGLQMNLFTGNTTAEYFMEVLTCKDLSQCTKKVYLGLKTNLFYYFLQKCKSWAKYFTPARIEQSGIFISQNDGVINAHLLYNSKLILKEDSDRIDAIFNAKYR
ncbi:MAG TPA: DUF6617 family protein [Prolixibacteraceae bacterium]|nr:DUF6617 family protein [Prolixibacteraceae bacterium]